MPSEIDREAAQARAQYRFWNSGEIDDELRGEMLAVLVRAFHGWEVGWHSTAIAPADHLRWRMEGAPGRPSIATTITLDGQVAGVSLWLRRRFLGPGGRLEVLDAVDSCIDPAFQGLGLMRRRQELGEELYDDDFDISLGYSLDPAMKHVDELFGRRVLANPIRIFARTHKAWALAGEVGQSRRGHLARFPLLLGAKWLGRWRARHEHPSALIRGAIDFDERFDSFLDAAQAPFDLIQLRDRSYLRWRYVDPRGGGFHIRIAEDAGDVVGYSVIKIRGQRAYLVDLLALPERLDVAAALIQDAVDQAEAAGVAGMSSWMAQQHPYTRLLERCGFVDSHRPTGLAIGVKRKTWDEMAPLLDPNLRVHLMEGDTDMA
jgi:GNAT superfamily N-acetyltransferase